MQLPSLPLRCATSRYSHNIITPCNLQGSHFRRCCLYIISHTLLWMPTSYDWMQTEWMYYGSGTFGRCCICTRQTLHVHSPNGSTFTCEMTSRTPSWTHDVIPKMLKTYVDCMTVPNFISIQFEIEKLWAFLKSVAPTTRRWVAIWEISSWSRKLKRVKDVPDIFQKRRWQEWGRLQLAPSLPLISVLTPDVSSTNMTRLNVQQFNIFSAVSE